MKKYTHNKETGKFCSPNPEPLAKKVIGVRLPKSMDAVVREIAGDELSEWIREAIASRLRNEGFTDLIEKKKNQNTSI